MSPTSASITSSSPTRGGRANWYPLPPGEEVAEAPAHPGQPSLGGC